MTITEARGILGLGEDEDPVPHLDQFESARERIAEMVKTAPNAVLAERYRQGLEEFDQALAAIHEYLDSWGSNDGEETEVRKSGKAIFVGQNLVADLSVLPPLPGVSSAERPKAHADGTQGISNLTAFVILLLVALCGSGVWYGFKRNETNEILKQQKLAHLEKEGAMLIESRRWQDAAKVYDELEKMAGASDKVKAGRRDIEAGMVEEQNQFVGYWLGEVRFALDQGRWDDAERAGKEILSKYPDEKEVVTLLATVSKQKIEQEKQIELDGVRKMVEERKFDEALERFEKLNLKYEGDSKTKELKEYVIETRRKAYADLALARELLEKAKQRDRGEFDADALEWLREAVSLAPDDKEVLQYYEKLASYTRTLRIPEDYSTIEKALSVARQRDRIVIGEGVWDGAFVLDKPVSLEGLAGKTILQCAADAGCVVTIQAGTEDVRLSGLSFRHSTLDPAAERFPLVLIGGSKAEITDCRFEKGNGHGLAVNGGGHAKVLRSHFSENSWNGIAVIGNGSLLEAENNVFLENFQNGIEGWDGGALILKSNECRGNHRNGIHIDIGASSATITGNVLQQNLEYGLVLSSAGSGSVETNVMKRNELGGMVVRATGKEVTIKKNVITSNAGAGLAIEYGLDASGYEENKVEKNSGGDVLKSVVFDAE